MAAENAAAPLLRFTHADWCDGAAAALHCGRPPQGFPRRRSTPRAALASFSSAVAGLEHPAAERVWSSPGTSLCRNLPMSSLICRLSIVCGLYPGYAFIDKTAWRGATPPGSDFFSYFSEGAFGRAFSGRVFRRRGRGASAAGGAGSGRRSCGVRRF